MNIRERAETFSRYVGLELKGKIVSQQFTAKQVAEGIGRQPAAFNRWLNGKVEMPLTVFCEACEFINLDPAPIIDDAYSRMAVEYGERDGHIYTDDDENFVYPDVGGFEEDDFEVTPGGPKSGLALAANKRPKKVDIPHAE